MGNKKQMKIEKFKLWTCEKCGVIFCPMVDDDDNNCQRDASPCNCDGWTMELFVDGQRSRIRLSVNECKALGIELPAYACDAR